MQFFWFDGKYVFWFLFIFDRLGSLCESLDFESLSSLQKCRQLVLGYIHLTSVHELQDGGQMGEGDVFEDNDGMLGRVLLQQGLEVGTAGGEDHLVSLAALAVAFTERKINNRNQNHCFMSAYRRGSRHRRTSRP